MLQANILDQFAGWVGLTADQLLRLIQIIGPAVGFVVAVIGIILAVRRFFKGVYLDDVVASRNFIVEQDGKDTLIMATIAVSTVTALFTNWFMRLQVRRALRRVAKKCPAPVLWTNWAHSVFMRRMKNLVSASIPADAGPQLMIVSVEDTTDPDFSPDEHKVRPKLVSLARAKRIWEVHRSEGGVYQPELTSTNHQSGLDVINFMVRLWFEKGGKIGGKDGKEIVVLLYPPWTKEKL